MCLPPAMELLYDDSANVRSALVEFVVQIMRSNDATCFVSAMPVAVTYLCSGLTSLNGVSRLFLSLRMQHCLLDTQGIQRDSMSIVSNMASLHPTLLGPYITKVFSTQIMPSFKLALCSQLVLTGAG